MKKYILLGIACLTLVLTGCATNHSYYQAQVRTDLVQEDWVRLMNLNPNDWTRSADRWFFTGEPHNFDQFASKAPADSAITAMMVRAPDFTNLEIAGPYRVQIYGHQQHNSVVVLGSNNDARYTAVEVQGQTLKIHPATDCRGSCVNLNTVVIRIGIKELNNLVVNGTGLIEGKEINSRHLNIYETGSSQVILSGKMNLQNVIQTGTGTISIIGAYTPLMGVKVTNSGNVNISGRVGIRRILKTGTGTLHIVGADTDGLAIDSRGSGLTTVYGFINLTNVNVIDSSRVYLSNVISDGIDINVQGNSRLGLAGNAKNLGVGVDGNARFLGKYLCGENIYIRTRHSSHANVRPTQRLVANALDNSSIYVFGSPYMASRYTTGNGIVIPIADNGCFTAQPRSPYLPSAVKAPLYKDAALHYKKSDK
jgi:hypothetical protein